MSRGTRAASSPARRHALSAEARLLRRETEVRYTEVDLLVVTLRDHIRDLQAERDRLLTDVARLRDEIRRDGATWMRRGQRPQRAASRE
jgi:hypothetical protein